MLVVLLHGLGIKRRQGRFGRIDIRAGQSMRGGGGSLRTRVRRGKWRGGNHSGHRHRRASRLRIGIRRRRCLPVSLSARRRRSVLARRRRGGGLCRAIADTGRHQRAKRIWPHRLPGICARRCGLPLLTCEERRRLNIRLSFGGRLRSSRRLSAAFAHNIAGVFTCRIG